jgi:LysM repeat protein
MKRILSKTFKFSRFTVSFFTNEIVIVYFTNKKVYIKTLRFKSRNAVSVLKNRRSERSMPHVVRAHGIKIIRRGFSHFYHAPVRKKLVYSLVLLMAGVIFFFSSYPNRENSANQMTKDELIKNNILKSETTDYSSPQKNRKLVINEYIVKKGETLQRIAKYFGVSVDTIVGTNNLKSNTITEGMILKIPNKDGILLKISPGMNAVGVARLYKVSLEKIINENQMRNPDFISPGTVLFIPDAKPLNIFDGFLWPTSSRRITCGYGWRRNPFDPRFSEFHHGLDICASYEWVRSSKYGKVTYTGWLGGYGLTVIVAHPGGWNIHKGIP